jgi:NAD(P)-dependent dehydrogenase (short-subunit alcohol dehydrogenase family)
MSTREGYLGAPTTALHPTTDSAASGSTSRPFAVGTGASSGIGLELPNEFAGHGFDGAAIARVAVDLAEPGGVEELFRRIAPSPQRARPGRNPDHGWRP